VVIGGTGMLRRVSVAIARDSKCFTAIARTSASLEALAREIGNAPGRRQSFIALDWGKPNQFVSALAERVAQLDPPSLVLAWLHDSELGPRVADAVSGRGTPCDFFQVLGSSAGGPLSGAAELRRALENQPGLTYHQVVLGFKLEGASSRWLTHEEISSGVLDAISTMRPSYVVGSTTPWEKRPENAA